MERKMNIVSKITSLPRRLRNGYRTRRTAELLESLPEEIRKDIGWRGTFQDHNW
jgi:hypothetical protein